MLTPTWKTPGLDLEVCLTSPPQADGSAYRLTGQVRGAGAAALLEGGSVLVLDAASGLAQEVFLDGKGGFAADLDVDPAADSHYRLTVYDPFGREVAGATLTVGRGGGAPAAPPALEPAWPQFARRVKECLYLAGKAGDATGRSPQEWFEQVYAQERYAEAAYAATDPARYRECFDNLGELAGYLERLGRAHLPG